MKEVVSALWSLGKETAFWSAVAGAVVGGLIALVIQLVNLRASKRQRDEDRLYTRQALGNSLLFKVVRIHSNIFGIHHHIETCYKSALKLGGESEPWNFMIPLANPPEFVFFSADEMAMLLALKDNELFNLVMSLDVIHNSLVEMLKLLNVTRKDLTDRLKVQQIDGTTLSGVFSENEKLALRPKMIEVNALAEQVRMLAKNYYDDSAKALEQLAELLRSKLNLTYSIERIRKM